MLTSGEERKRLLDNRGSDTVPLSWCGMVPRKGYNPRRAFKGLENRKTLLTEASQDGESRKPGRYDDFFYDGKQSAVETVWKEFGV